MKKLLDFYADWCPPCKTMIPVIEKLEKKFTVDKINVDDKQEMAANYSVMSIPTYVILEDDKEIKRFVGATPENVLEQALKE